MYHSKYIDEKSVTSDEMQRCLKEGIAGIKGEDALMLIDAVIDEDLERAVKGICKVGEKAPLTKENIKKWFDNAETNVFSTYNGSPFSEDEINDFLDETGIGYENDNVDYAEVDWDKVMDYLGRTEDASISFHYYNYGAVFMDMTKDGINISVPFPSEDIIGYIEECKTPEMCKELLAKRKETVSRERE